MPPNDFISKSDCDAAIFDLDSVVSRTPKVLAAARKSSSRQPVPTWG